MKQSTKHAITAGILFGIGLHHFQRATMAVMADDICQHDTIVFHTQTGKTKTYEVLNCPCETEEEASDEA